MFCHFLTISLWHFSQHWRNWISNQTLNQCLRQLMHVHCSIWAMNKIIIHEQEQKLSIFIYSQVRSNVAKLYWSEDENGYHTFRQSNFFFLLHKYSIWSPWSNYNKKLVIFTFKQKQFKFSIKVVLFYYDLNN